MARKKKERNLNDKTDLTDVKCMICNTNDAVYLDTTPDGVKPVCKGCVRCYEHLFTEEEAEEYRKNKPIELTR